MNNFTENNKNEHSQRKNVQIHNKTAPASFKIFEKIEAGIVLLGSEVKAVRGGHADLTGSYVKIMESEAYLVNAKIFPYKFSRIEGYDESRTRKLLLHKREIIALKSKISQGNFTLTPLSMYVSNSVIKLEIGLSKGKKQFEKKKLLKEKDIQRDIERELKEIIR
ncbi:SsrA-binding protein SmpB [Candidatus Parcubacteria bacterium]|nr:MAG: SsrA-binding protein SmpB [Candidatus Parcubacteria bacterium]